MSYEKLKKEIKEISEIAASVPEAFREKCFEILLNHVLSGDDVKKTPKGADKGEKQEKQQKPPKDTNLPSHVKAFMRRRDITEEQINSLVMLDGEDLHFIKEPSHNEASRGQNEWSLLLALKNGILHNSLKADPEDVRSLVQEKGYYNAANFSTNFKKAKYAAYFKEALEPQGSAQALSPDGEKALAELIRSLTS